MNSPHPHKQNVFALELNTSSLVSLLERGLSYAKQGKYAEGVALFALVRERLSPQQKQLTDTLDIFIKGYVDYWQAQQTIQQSSKRFVEIETTQQDTTSILEKLFLTLIKDLYCDRNKEALPLVEQVSCNVQPPSNTTPIVPVAVVSSPPGVASPQGNMLAPLHITCFGHFEVRRQNQPVALCPNRNGQTIFRYLVAQSEHSATMDVLMTELWADDEQEVAHHKLQVAISALRRSLNSGYEGISGGGYILCKQGAYQINPSVSLSTDVEEFVSLYQAGQHAGDTIALYEQACALYTGPFLTEDLYADWYSLRREQLSHMYLTMCNTLVEEFTKLRHYERAITWAIALLEENGCDEDAYRHLMCLYAAQGRRSEALRQYQRCRQVLSEELGIEPMPETTQIFHSLLSGKITST